MRIGIDVRLWNETGVGRYIRNLISNLAKIDKQNEYFLFAKSSDEKEIRSIIHNLKFTIQTLDLAWHSIAEQLNLPKILNKQNLDLMHFPYFSIPIFYNKPYVVTVHDLIVNKFNTGRASTLPLPFYHAKRLGYNAVLANAVYRSKKIIVPSNAVKSELLSSYKGVKSSKVEVIYEGGFQTEIKDQRSKIKDLKLVEGKYLLRVGNFYPHKNVERLLVAFHDFLYDDYDNHAVKLVLVGKRDYFFDKIEKLIETLNVGNNVIFFENIKDEDLLSLYSGALATIVPSLAEGFSLTALEGLSCGSVLLASDIPVHREIAQDSAIYFNPGKVADIKQKIVFATTLIDKSREELVEGGLKQAKKFSWRKMAEATLDVYNSIEA